MWIKIKKWLSGNTASGIYAYTLTKKLFHTNNAPKLKLVENKKFMKQTIGLDGYRYRDCTLEYCGGNYEIDGSYMIYCQLSFNHPIACNALQLVYPQLKLIKKPEDIEMVDKYNRIIDDKIFINKVEKPKL